MSLLDAPLPALFPETFFEVSAPLYKAGKLPLGSGKKKYLLPDASSLLDEEKFADFYMSWDYSGISILCEVQTAFTDSAYPKFEDGDALEILIDTRDLKEVGVVHRFCHHFLILPVEVQGVRALEISNFRGEDKHPLVDPSEIIVEASFKKRDYSLSIFLPKEALFGYDPTSVPRLGFAYRLHRSKGSPQHFPLSTHVCAIERFPALWASLQLKE